MALGSVFATLIVGGVLASQPASNSAPDGVADFQLTSTDFVPGETAVIDVKGGPPGALHLLFFDLGTGNFWLNQRQWFGLAVSPAFKTLALHDLDGDGATTIRVPVPLNSGFEGEEFFLQGVSFKRGELGLSNRLDETVETVERGDTDAMPEWGGSEFHEPTLSALTTWWISSPR